MIKKVLIFALLPLLSPLSIYAECQASVACPNKDDAIWNSCYSKWQFSYECSVASTCLGQKYGADYWNFDTSKQLIITHDMSKYPDLGKTGGGLNFDDVHKIYEKTQNNIMNCSILKSKYTLHKKLIDDYKIKWKAKAILEEANKTIEKQINEQKCIPPRDGDKIYNSKDLLDSLSYEECVYTMYLSYYSAVCDRNISSCTTGKQIYTANEARQVIQTENNKMAEESDLSQKALTTALSLYENFERTYIAHILLELIEIELTEDKRFMGVAVKALMQWVSLSNNAQRATSGR